jgi:hypothetical protein
MGPPTHPPSLMKNIRSFRRTDRADCPERRRTGENDRIVRGTRHAVADRSGTRSGRGGLQGARRRRGLALASNKREWRRGLSGAIESRVGSRASPSWTPNSAEASVVGRFGLSDCGGDGLAQAAGLVQVGQVPEAPGFVTTDRRCGW